MSTKKTASRTAKPKSSGKAKPDPAAPAVGEARTKKRSRTETEAAAIRDNEAAAPLELAAKADASASKLSALGAAARVLQEAGSAMSCPEMIDAMTSKGYWTSPGGKTPAATIYASIIREIRAKGPDARFRKTERGQFAATGVA